MNVDDLEPFLGIRGYWQHPNVQAFLQQQLACQLEERWEAVRTTERAAALMEGRADEGRAMLLRLGTAKFGKPTK